MAADKIEKQQFDVSGRLTGDRVEPKIDENGKLECSICKRLFSSRQEYDSHWLSCHQDEGMSLASGSMGSMQSDGEHCEEPVSKAH